MRKLVEGWTDPIDYVLERDGVAENLTGKTVVLRAYKKTGVLASFGGSVTVVNAAAGLVRFTPISTDLKNSDSPYYIRWRVDPDGFFVPNEQPEIWEVSSPGPPIGTDAFTTAMIADFADPSKIANPGFHVQQVLRRKVIPRFFDAVGLVGWRRMMEVVSTSAGERGVDISAFFSEIRNVYYNGNPLVFIGDSTIRMDQALASDVPASPSAYWIDFNYPGTYNDQLVVGPVGPRKLMLSAPADAVYSMKIFGWRAPYFQDDFSIVDMNNFMPRQFVWALVEGLRAEIYWDRNGIGDETASRADAIFREYVAQASSLRNMTIEETPRYA